jgi:type IV pilus assembly protein PilA
MNKVQQGFTLIELMIVVAIIGILASIAIPAYQDYIARAQAAEAPTLLGGLKTGISEWYSLNGDMPTPGELSATTTGKYIATLTNAGGTDNDYVATFKNTAGSVNEKLKGRSITMTYTTSTGAFNFDCSTIDTGIQPSACD